MASPPTYTDIVTARFENEVKSGKTQDCWSQTRSFQENQPDQVRLRKRARGLSPAVSPVSVGE